MLSINRRKKYVIVFDNLTCADIRTKELLTVSQLAAGCHGVRLWLIRKANTFSIYPTTPQKIISTFFRRMIEVLKVQSILKKEVCSNLNNTNKVSKSANIDYCLTNRIFS